jgi:hypothetical protein
MTRYKPGDLNIYRYEDGEAFWVAAPSPDEALAYLRQDYDLDDATADDITRVPDEELLTYTDEDTGEKETRTARELADGTKFICVVMSTVW